MAIFISYSHTDSRFVDILAANLVRKKHHVWMDRWELNLGDSITEKVQTSLTGSDAMLIILSKNSVQSNWCKRELTAGLLRELEEQKTIVMPVVIEDCEIPLFLRDKLYADFRKNPDEAFDLIDRSLAKISNPAMARREEPNFFTDYSYDWKMKDVKWSEETWVLRFSFVDHGPNLPYVIVSECKIHQIKGNQFEESIKNGSDQKKIKAMSIALHEKFVKDGDQSAIISDANTQFEGFRFKLSDEEEYLAMYYYRKLGQDNGMDTVVHLGKNLRMVRDHLSRTIPD